MAEARRRLASELGCILDCDLSTGLTADGRRPTDNTSRLNAFLATATATAPVCLVLDGPALVTGLILNGGHTTIEGIGPDSGIFLRAGSNAHAIRNHPAMQGDPGAGHTAPPRLNFGITLRNFRINGNRGSGRNGNTDSGITYDNSARVMLYGIDLVHASAIWLEDLVVHDATTYAITLSNCSAVVCRGLRITAPSSDRNTDGIHINGPASDIHISDCSFQTGDDPIALNAPEAFGGPISRVAIANCIFDNCPTAIRAYGCAYPPVSYAVSDVLLSNCTGSLTNTPFMIGFQQNALVDTIQTLQASNCTFTASYWATLNESCGDLQMQANTWDSPPHPGFFLWLPLPVQLSSITLADCRIYRTTRGSAAASLLFAAPQARGSVIRKLTLAGFAIDNQVGGAFPPIPYLLDTEHVTLQELFIGSLDPTNISALIKPQLNFRGVERVSGPGVLSAGFPIPDALIAENTPYISASESHVGLPCIKLAGQVKKL